MIDGWAVAAFVMVLLLFGVVIVFLMRISTQNEIIIRAIPLAPQRIQERVAETRRPQAPLVEEQRTTRPVGATTSTGRHG